MDSPLGPLEGIRPAKTLPGASETGVRFLASRTVRERICFKWPGSYTNIEPIFFVCFAALAGWDGRICNCLLGHSVVRQPWTFLSVIIQDNILLSVIILSLSFPAFYDFVVQYTVVKYSLYFCIFTRFKLEVSRAEGDSDWEGSKRPKSQIRRAKCQWLKLYQCRWGIMSNVNALWWPRGVTVAGGGAEPHGGFLYRLQVPGERCAPQHRGTWLSLWSGQRKCTMSCGVL